jgi:hypothetical protein
LSKIAAIFSFFTLLCFGGATAFLVTPGASAGTTTTPTPTTLPSLFNGSFETGTYKPWSTPECANYGQPLSPTRTFGNFYMDRSNPGAGSYSGRFDLPADPVKLTRCEVFYNRTINVGGDDYYSQMVYLPNGWTAGTGAFWGVSIAQFNWEIVGSDVALQAHSDHVTLAVQTGVCTNAVCQYRSNADSTGAPTLPALYAIPKPMQLGVWHELIVHIHWATDKTGVIEVWHRVKGQSAWTKTASLTGYPTLQTNPDGSYPNGTLDKNGAYRAQSTAPTSIWLDGYSRSQSFAAAASNLP